MTTETKSTLRKELVGMSRDKAWEWLIDKIERLDREIRKDFDTKLEALSREIEEIEKKRRFAI